MRKFTFILSLLVAFVATAMAQVEVGKVYTMTRKIDATSAVTESDGKLYARTLAEGERSQQWLIEAGENGVMVRNMSTGRYMNPMGTSTQWITVQYEPANLYAVAVGEYWTLNTTNDTNNYYAMHMAGGGNIVGWETSTDNTQWNFTEVAVDAAELEGLVAGWDLADLIARISEPIGKVVLTPSMISSNANIGYHDGAYADMLDGNPNTHYGTAWAGYISQNHYIQIDLGEEALDIDEFTYTWVNRNNANNTPEAGYISASTDNVTFDKLVTFDKTADGSSDVQSVNVDAGGSNAFGPLSMKNAQGEAYRYIRLTCTSSNFNQTEVDYTMAIAELALKVKTTPEDEAILAHCATAQAVLDNADATIDEIKAAKETLFNAVMCEVTYNYNWNGNLIKTSTVEINKDSQYPALQVPYGYVVASGAPEGVCEESGTFEIELNVALPFEYAASYSEIEHWYFMTIHGTNKFYLADNDTLSYIALEKKSIPAAELDKYTWAFVGDPINGFSVVNKAAGETKILSSSTNTYDGNTGGSTFPILTTTPVAEGNNTLWIPSQGTAENGFWLEQKGHSNNKMNARSGKLAYWNSSADAGSTFLVAERDLNAELPVVNCAPAAGDVASLSTITLTCTNDIALSGNSGLVATLSKTVVEKDTTYVVVYNLSSTVISDSISSSIKLTSNETLEDGEYTLNIPAGYLTVNVNGAIIESDEIEAVYTLVIPSISAPILDTEAGIYEGEALRIGFSAKTEGVKGYPSIKYYYTTDGSTPTKDSNTSGAAIIMQSCVINVMAVMTVDGVEYTSDVTTAEYILSEMKPFKVATSVEELADTRIFIAASDSLVAKSLSLNKEYGYLYTATKAVNNGCIENWVYYAYTLTAVEGGYTIQDQYNRYLYQTGDFNSFNVSDTIPAEGAVWTIVIAENGEATITNTSVNKYIQYSTAYESFGSYAEAGEGNLMPVIYVESEYPTLAYTPCEYPDLPSISTITFACDGGLALSGEGSATLSSWSGTEYELTAKVIDENTIELSVPQEIKTPSAWTLSVTPGYFVLNPDGMAIASSEVWDMYTIIDTTPFGMKGSSPTEGEVTSLKYVIVEFTKDVQPFKNASLLNEKGEEVAVGINDIYHPVTGVELDWNFVVYVFPEEITAPGKYTFYLPAGSVYGSGEDAPEITIEFTIPGGETAIDGVDAENGEVVIYDITGRKVEAITSAGVYIVNGKKVVVK